MRNLLSTLLLLMSMGALFAQQGSIQGTVSDQAGNLIPFANISLSGTAKGSTTNKDGFYEITRVNSGTYTLLTTFIGYENEEAAITVAGGETVTVNFILREAPFSLQTVEITGREATSYDNEISFIGTKTATALKDVPQA
ncbi:MAG: carboxypeptidase-like regulatory domain-containing protein, partial [Bacteroidota bacterium]